MSKPFWASKTVIVNLVALLASVLGELGVASIGVDAQGYIVGIVMSIANIALRVVTKDKVSLT